MGSDEMESRRTGKVFRAVVFALTAFMIGFAFVHSSMSAAASSVESAEALDFITQIFRSLGFSIEMTDHIIRKLAHFSEFTVIGGLLTSCAYSFDRFKPYRYIFAVLFTGLFTAVIDEAIQLFSDGRSGQITDVLLDFSGVLTGTLIMLLFYKIYINIRTKSKRDKKENGTD